jgi:hemolysin III
MASDASFPAEISPSETHYESGGAVTEILNSLTHALGAGLSIAGLIVLLILAAEDPSPWKVVGFSIYGISQILLYLSSAIMHGFWAFPRFRYYLRILDQVLIYVMIAGTYTPLCLIAMRGNGGWWIFGIIWGLAVVGIFLKGVVFKEPHIASDLLYLPMGWMLLFFLRPLIETVPTGFLVWALIGAASFSIGIIFYILQRFPFFHTIWHLFVIAGSVSFFLGYALHLA